MTSRAAAVAAVTSVFMLAVSVPAQADPVSVGGGDGFIDTSVSVPDSPGGASAGGGGVGTGVPVGDTGAPGSSSSGPPPCTYERLTPEQAIVAGLPVPDGGGVENLPHSGGWYYLRRCAGAASLVMWIPDGTPAAPGAGPAAGVIVVTPAMLAQEARNRLQLPMPEVGVSPDDAGGPSLVNLPTWWWVTNAEPLSQRTQAGPVWAEVTATPYATSWIGGDGGRQDCPGLGIAYAAGMSETQAGSCRYTYTAASEGFDARIQVVWRVTWVGSGGTGGQLDPMTQETSRTVPVYERHAIVTAGQGPP